MIGIMICLLSTGFVILEVFIVYAGSCKNGKGVQVNAPLFLNYVYVLVDCDVVFANNCLTCFGEDEVEECFG